MVDDDEDRVRPDWKRIERWTDTAGDARRSAEVLHAIASIIEIPGTALLGMRELGRIAAESRFGIDPGWFFRDLEEDQEWEEEGEEDE